MKSSILLLFISILFPITLEAQNDFPISGEEVPEMKSVEDSLIAFMNKWNVPGGQLAVTKNGKLVYSRAFGYADRENKIPINTGNMMRIASVSKSITGVAVMKLIQDGKVKLSDKALDILNDFAPPNGNVKDPRWYDITIEMLLEHLGGFSLEHGDRQVTYLRKAADAFGTPRPATARQIIEYGMGEMLDFTPGTQYVYSNFGYNILGRIIEKVTGKTYEKYVQDEILAPAGVTDMIIAKTKLSDKLPNEVIYYGNPQYEPMWSVLDEAEQVNFPYGGDYFIEVMDAHGGWLSRAEDLVKFVTSVDYTTNRPHVLTKETVELMLGKPEFMADPSANHWYGKGWNNDVSGEWSHAGALWGVSSYIMRYGNGVSVAVIFNYLAMMDLGDYLGYLKFDLFPMIRDMKDKMPEGKEF
jgi:CubicO group peptidase (beta-lactamase class C family)